MVSSTKKAASTSAPTKAADGSMWVVVQKKSTPRRKPRNSGGSPSGVSEPPMLETRKMKKTMTWALWRRLSLARMIGRIMIIDAPVVPTTEAISAPIRSRPELTIGVPRRLPETRMPPEMVNRANSRMMNDMYSSSIVCSTA